MNHSFYLPGACPLIVDVCGDLGYTQAGQAILVSSPLVALGSIGTNPAKGLRGLSIGHFGRENWHEVIVGHFNAVGVGDVDEV